MSDETVNHVTDEVLAFIGVESEPVTAWDPVERGAIRRHTQATMDDDPLYWDDEYAAATRYSGVVAPPLFPLHAFRRAPATADPLDGAFDDPDHDGAGQGLAARLGLPPIPIKLKRMLNGGNDVEIRALARPGDRIVARSRYRDIYQKEGKSGQLVFVIVETTYSTEAGQELLISRQTQIWR